MIKIAEVLPDHPTPLWRMVKQCGVDHVVGGFSTQGDPSDIHPEQRPWSFTNLVRMKTAFNDGGFSLDVIEARPPLNKAKPRPLGPRRGDRIRLRADSQHGQGRHSGLVPRVDARDQLDSHLNGCAWARRCHGHRL